MRRRTAVIAVSATCAFAVAANTAAFVFDVLITDADEAFYAEASREMVESGDWLTPRFNYQNRWEKPVLYYWLTSATYLATGPTESAARFWSALSGVGLALLVWGIARHATGRVDVAWLAGAVVTTSFGYFSMARAALPDLPLPLWQALVEELTQDHSMVRNGPWLHLPGHVVTLSEIDRQLAQRLQSLIGGVAATPPAVVARARSLLK